MTTVDTSGATTEVPWDPTSSHGVPRQPPPPARLLTNSRTVAGLLGQLHGPRPLICGILNVTPDSFSDGGIYRDHDAAVAHGVQLAADGADIIDVGGESTRPAAQPAGGAEELDRVIPVMEKLATRVSVPLSVGTGRPAGQRETASVTAALLAVQRAAGVVRVHDVAATRDAFRTLEAVG